MLYLEGLKFGILTVLERGELSEKRAPQWLCKCDCGNIKVILQSKLLEDTTNLVDA
jgi:hypothetical protein